MTKREFAQMLDGTAVQFNMQEGEVMELLNLANQYRFKAVAVMAEHWDMALRVIREAGNTETQFVGGSGFPDGLAPTGKKLRQLQKSIARGATELDITNNISFIKEGKYDAMLEELKLLVDGAEGRVTKVIIETPKLTEDEIRRASEVVAKCGATFLKSATGHYGATTVEHVKIMYETVGGAIKLKAASGIRSIDTVNEMLQYGVSRFGVGIRGIHQILDACDD